MLRGLIAGGLSGLVVGGSALAVLSVVNEPPAGNVPPEDPQVQAPSEASPTDIASALPDTVADDSTGDAVAGSAPQVVSPEPTLTAPVADTSPAAVPQTGAAEALPDAPETGDAPEVDVDVVDPVLPNPQSVAPQVPAGEQDIIVSTEPAAVPEPVIEDGAEPVADKETNATTETDDAQGSDGPAADSDADNTAPQVETPTGDDTGPAPEAPDEPTPESPAIDEEPATSEPSGDDTATQTPEQPQAPAVVSIVPDASPSLPGGDTGVAVRRPATQDTQIPPADEVEEAIDPDAPAIERYASRFDNPEGKPMVSVVLIDDGSLQGAAAAVASLEMPITVVLDPDQDDVAQKMADYRAAGIEVAVRAALPASATPTDVEAAFGVSFAKLPESVLLIDDGTAGLQNNRAITEFAMETLSQDGRGFLTISSGLNTALRLAEQNGVPAGVIYRDLDGDGQDATVIRRFLDQAAFRARQDDVVFLLGRVRPDTISALILWGTANRADQVVFAPASAALTAKGQ